MHIDDERVRKEYTKTFTMTLDLTIEEYEKIKVLTCVVADDTSTDTPEENGQRKIA